MLSVSEAQRMISDLKSREVSLGRDPKTWYIYENHVYGVATMAKRIASRIDTMDPNRLYVMGLLHDISRTEDNRLQRFHGNLGYEKLLPLDPEVARICLLHSFPWDKLPPYPPLARWFYHSKKDYNFVADYIKTHTPKEEDYLIQLCDCLANKNGLVTIEQRAEEILDRHRKTQDFVDIVTINELKRYFDDKIGCDVYSLFDE